MIKRSFAGETRSFHLGYDEILELERIAGYGIGAITTRLQLRQFSIRELAEVVRLALIGGGMHANKAQEIVEYNVKKRPILESYPLAGEIINAAWIGDSPAAETGDQAQAETRTDQENNAGDNGQ